MKKVWIHIAALTSMFFWGFSYIWSKIVFETYSPLTTIFLRLVISTIFLFLYIYVSGLVEKIDKKDFGLFAVSALLNPFLYFLGENFGLSLVPASLSSIIVATIPLFAPFAAYYFFKERLQPVNLAGLILSFTGLLIIIVNKDFEITANPWGILFLFGAVFSAVFYSIVLKKLTFKYKPLTIITWQNLIGSVYFLPLFLVFEWKRFSAIIPDVDTISSLLMLGIFASSVAYVLFAYIVNRLGVIKSSLYTNIIPVFTSLFAFFILGETFTNQKIIGMAVVIAGVFLSETGSRKKEKIIVTDDD